MENGERENIAPPPPSFIANAKNVAAPGPVNYAILAVRDEIGVCSVNDRIATFEGAIYIMRNHESAT